MSEFIPLKGKQLALVEKLEAEIERLTTQNTEAAGFLDLLANNLGTANMPLTAADCRAMAAKLRGKE